MQGRQHITIAIETGQNDALRHLIECGAVFNVTSGKQISVLHDAVEHYDGKYGCYFVKSSSKTG
jgi:hypothetical protein